MRIAYLCSDPGIPYGGTKGSSVHVASVVSALADVGSQVLVLVRRVHEPLPEPPRGVTVEVLPGPGRRAPVADRLAAEPGVAAWLSGRLADFGAACLYERLALHSAAGTDAASRLGIPHLLEINAPLLEEAKRYRRLDHFRAAAALEEAALTGADLVFAVTQPLARYALERGARRVEVLPNAAALPAVRASAPRPGQRPVAVLLGTLRRWHGVDVLCEAWRMLGPNVPRLLVIGDGHGRAALEAVGAEVTGVLPHELVADALAGGHIGLAPYAADAPRYFSPLKVFDYLAAGLAVVAADLPGVVDVVGDGPAVLVPTGDAPRLAHAVASLAGDPAAIARLGAAGRALIASGHTWRHRAQRILRSAADLSLVPTVMTSSGFHQRT